MIMSYNFSKEKNRDVHVLLYVQSFQSNFITKFRNSLIANVKT